MKKHIWHSVDSHPELLVGQYIVPNFVSNSVAIKLSDSEFILISPGQPLLKPFIETYGSNIKLHIIFPNAYHYMGASAWVTAFKDVTLYASQLAGTQLKQKEIAPLLTQKGLEILEQTPPPLPASYSILFPPGHKAGDVWLCKRNALQADNSATHNGSTYITCDSFLNYDRVSNQPIARFMQKLLGAAPGLKISQVVKWFIMDNRHDFKKWAIEQLNQDQPTTLIPSHGEVKHSSTLTADLLKVISQRL